MQATCPARPATDAKPAAGHNSRSVRLSGEGERRMVNAGIGA
jgi:hypothetical protein